jgi:hypothetical protein
MIGKTSRVMPFIRVHVLSAAILALLASGAQPSFAQSSGYTQRIKQAISWYEKNPRYMNVYCGGLRSHNRTNNASAFDPGYIAINARIQKWTFDETLAFHAYVVSNYCGDVW